jgi:type I restriction enzyme, S subunit
MTISSVSNLPTGWRVEKLKHLAAVQASNVDKHSVEGEASVLLCNYTDVYNNDRITAGMPFMQATARAEEIDRFSLRAGDVLITKDSESWNDIAVPALVTESLPGVLCGYHLSQIRPSDSRLDGGFLFYAFKSGPVNSQLQVAANGVTRFGLPAYAIENVELPVPPLHEQRAIAAFLDGKTVEVETLIAKKAALLDLVAEKRQAVITHAVTKGLDPRVPMKDTGIPWLGDMPAHWEVKRLDYLNDSMRPIMYGIVLPGPDFPGGVPIIKGGDVKPSKLTLDHLSRTDPEIDRDHARSRVRPGDLVYAIRGGVGDVELVPIQLDGANLTQDAARIAPLQGVDRKWLLYTLKSDVASSQTSSGTLGATIKGVNIRDLKKIILPVPTSAERSQIAEFLDAHEQKATSAARLVEQHIALLVEYCSALITAAVTGKIDVWGREPVEAVA